MWITIEFFRTRPADHAHALVGRETAEAGDLLEAIGIGRRLGLSLHMPQRPDGLTIIDGEGTMLYSGALNAPPGEPRNPEPRITPKSFRGGLTLSRRGDHELSRWENEGGSTRPSAPDAAQIWPPPAG